MGFERRLVAKVGDSVYFIKPYYPLDDSPVRVDTGLILNGQVMSISGSSEGPIKLKAVDSIGNVHMMNQELFFLDKDQLLSIVPKIKEIIGEPGWLSRLREHTSYTYVLNFPHEKGDGLEPHPEIKTPASQVELRSCSFYIGIYGANVTYDAYTGEGDIISVPCKYEGLVSPYNIVKGGS